MDIKMQARAAGTKLVYAANLLEPHPYRLTERLQHWADVTPHIIFIAQRSKVLLPGELIGGWHTLTCAETFIGLKNIAQALLHKKVSQSRPIDILSENSIEHALTALPNLQVGIPFCSIAPHTLYAWQILVN